MIKIKNLATDITEVPSVWVFNHYLKELRVLTGQNEMIKSIFNHKDTNPSMSIYVKNGGYRWHDFSMGFGGSKIDLIMKIFNLEFSDACYKITSDYNQYILGGNSTPVSEFREQVKYKITGWERRKWTVLDRSYWVPFEIGSNHLEKFMVFPLSSYILQKENKRLEISGKMIYGFFTLAGELYKVYQPLSGERKFMKVQNHIQGMEQLEWKGELLIISKSLKDIICLHRMDFEAISPDSENSSLPLKIINQLKEKYKRIITLFDNDSCGLRSKIKYETEYNIPGIILPLEKDPSDNIKEHGSELVKKELIKLIGV